MTARRLTPLAVGAVLLGVLLGVPAADAADRIVPTAPAAPRAIPPFGAFDALYLADARPVLMRFRVTADGDSLAAAWERFADTLFAKLDTDTNGTIDGKELARLRPMLALLTGRGERPVGDAGGAALDRAAFPEFLRKNELGPFHFPTFGAPQPQQQQVQRIVRAGANPTPEELDKALLKLLDTNKDGKLSAAELAGAEKAFAAIDADENEMISTEELLNRPAVQNFFVQEMVNQQAGPGLELRPLVREGADADLARRLLAKYGPKPPTAQPVTPTPPMPKGNRVRRPVQTPAPPASTARRLTRKDLGLSEETFAALDRDGDGELDAEELARFGDGCPPEIEIALRLGTLPEGARPAEVIAAGAEPVTVKPSTRGQSVAMDVPGIRLDIVPQPTRRIVGRATFRARYLSRFQSLDLDGNGYVDAAETKSDPVFRMAFSFLDRDGDGKVFEQELAAVLDDLDAVAAAAATGVVAVDVAEAGKGLFGLIDADGDGRLSLREVRAMPKLIEQFDANKDGCIAPGEIPRRFQATVSRGLADRARVVQPVPIGFVMATQPTPKPPVGPVWFQKMDRNRDGDVSRREFLGTDEDFRRLDADGDGLIDAREAEAATREEVTAAPAASGGEK